MYMYSAESNMNKKLCDFSKLNMNIVRIMLQIRMAPDDPTSSTVTLEIR